MLLNCILSNWVTIQKKKPKPHTVCWIYTRGGEAGKLFIVPSFHPTFFSISLFSPPKVQPSAGTCQKPTPWSAWPTTTMKRTPSLAKWPRRRRSSAGGWRTNWKVPALSASPQPTPLAHSHGTNPAPPSPVPAPTIMRAPSTERLSCWLTFAVCKKRCGAQCQICAVLCYTHTGPAVDMVHYQCSLVSFVFVFFYKNPKLWCSCVTLVERSHASATLESGRVSSVHLVVHGHLSGVSTHNKQPSLIKSVCVQHSTASLGGKKPKQMKHSCYHSCLYLHAAWWRCSVFPKRSSKQFEGGKQSSTNTPSVGY